MAIAKKPNRNLTDVDKEAAALAFISGATPTSAEQPKAEKPVRQKKEPVIVRFDEATLKAIDDKAEKMGLSRAAWVRMVAARALKDGE